jgi:hypothetical protein
MPDPVGKAVTALLGRIDDLEAQLQILRRDQADDSQGLVDAGTPARTKIVTIN